MEKTVITSELLRRIVYNKHLNYTLTVDLTEKIRIHADGRTPTKLIHDRRPSEPEALRKYRESIYVPKTQNPIAKVLNSLEKIRRSQDWAIQYDESKVKSTIASDETLQQYCEYNYPTHTSITNWAFNELLREYLLDANAVVAVVPDEFPQKTSDYLKPVARIFESKNVIDFVDDEYCVLLSPDKTTYKTHNGTRIVEGLIYYYITSTQIFRLSQVSGKGEYVITLEYEHNIGRLPAFRVGGRFIKRVNNQSVYTSRIATMVPSLDEAAREYSDLQAEILQHIHSEKYAYTNADCPTCNGSGKNKDENGNYTNCGTCGGQGTVLNTSPFGIHLIDASKAGEMAIPSPPIGYIQKSTEIAKLQDERVRQHLYDALSTLNMEFLAETPLNQSGTAKQVDKDELNNFVNSIAEDIVRILDNVYSFINEYRYLGIVPNEDDRKAMLPSINVPTQYDLISSNMLIDELNQAKQGKISPVILRELEIDFARKKFNTQPDVAAMAEAIFTLDPFYGYTQEDKMTMLGNGGIIEEDYIISCNIDTFVKRASVEVNDFYNLDATKQRDVMLKYAQEKKTALPEPIPVNNNGL